MSKTKIIRCLGHVEAFYSAKHLLRQYCGTTVACRYTIPETLAKSESHQLRDAIDLALARTVLQHPFLQVGLIDEDSKRPLFVQLENIDFNHHVEWRDISPAEDYDAVQKEISQHLLDDPFVNRETTPGWRIVVLHRHESDSLELMFCWSHAICDGISAKIFHETLLDCLNPVDDASTPGLINRTLTLSDTAGKLPPPQENLSKVVLSVGYTASTMWKEFAISSRKPGTRAIWAPMSLEPYRAQLHTIIIDNMTLQNVLSACRKHGTTLTGLLHGILLLSLASQLQEHEAPGFASQTPIDMRRFAPRSPPDYPWLEPDRVMANIVSVMYHDFKAEYVSDVRKRIQAAAQEGKLSLAEVIWPIAVTARKDIQESIRLGLKNKLIGLMKFIPDWRSQLKDHPKKKRQHAWLVSNLGVLDGCPARDADKPGAWRIERAAFSTSIDPTGSALQLGVVAVKGHELCINVGWQDTVIDTKLAQQVVKDMEEWLNYLGQ